MTRRERIQWLLDGDVAIQFQAHRDLLGCIRSDLQDGIAVEGWGAQLLSRRTANGHWGKRFYQPKWTSTHYTLLDLRNLCITRAHPQIQASINLILENERGVDGGINPAGSVRFSDVCINGMFLNYATYFRAPEEKLKPVVDFLLSQYMDDGGFNCRSNRAGARHSSLHTTISVLEGIASYQKNGYKYRFRELEKVKQTSIEFILLHRLYLSDRTGMIIHPDFLKLRYPCRWKYDILRALDFFQYAGIPWDERMRPAIDVLLAKRNRHNTWDLNAKHPGKLHFEMEKAGKPSRWNTLRVLRVLQHFGVEENNGCVEARPKSIPKDQAN